MLSVVSSYLGQVVASDSNRGYLCSIVGSCLYLIKRSDKNLYGENNGLLFMEQVDCLPYTLCLKQLSVACNLILEGVQMITRRWISSHRCSWMAVYVSCCIAQSNLIGS